MADDESYSAENLRRIARSLSGTVIGGRSEHLAMSRSFVSVTHAHTLTHTRICLPMQGTRVRALVWEDRKSTRLNSSH